MVLYRLLISERSFELVSNTLSYTLEITRCISGYLVLIFISESKQQKTFDVGYLYLIFCAFTSKSTISSFVKSFLLSESSYSVFFVYLLILALTMIIFFIYILLYI